MSFANTTPASLSQPAKYEEIPLLDLGSPLPLRRTDAMEDYVTPPTTPHQPIPAPDIYGSLARTHDAERGQGKVKKVKKAKKSKKSKKNKKSKKVKKSKNAKTVMDGEVPIIIEGPVSARAVNMLKEGIKQSKARNIARVTLKRKKTPPHKSQGKKQEASQPMQGSPTKKPRREGSAAEDAKDYPEGFPGLRRWREASFNELLDLKQGDWISYTRGKWGGHGADPNDASKGRKKTVCSFFSSGTKHDGKEYIRVSSIPLSGARASTVRPNQTLSWDIFPAEQWTRAPKYYLMKAEENKKRLKAKARTVRRQQKPKEEDDAPMTAAGKTVAKAEGYEVETVDSFASSEEEGEATGSDSDSDAVMS